jgi:hypothetical protein
MAFLLRLVLEYRDYSGSLGSEQQGNGKKLKFYSLKRFCGTAEFALLQLSHRSGAADDIGGRKAHRCRASSVMRESTVQFDGVQGPGHRRWLDTERGVVARIEFIEVSF